MSGAVRRLIVTHHAVEQYQRRCMDERGFLDVEREIADTVRLALAEGRLADRKTHAFRLYRETKGRTLPRGERFVWNEEQSLGWIVRRMPDEDIVTTTLKRPITVAGLL